MRRVLTGVLLVVLVVLAGAPTAYSTFVGDQREVTIGAHAATVSPALDGWVRLDFGPLLPRLRLPSDGPAGLGADIRLGDTDARSIDELIARDAVIASQPSGEIETVHDAVRSMAVDAAARGLGVGLLVAIAALLVWRAVGPDRRRALWSRWRRPDRRGWVSVVAVGVVVVAAAALVVVPRDQGPERSGWLPFGSVFPDVPDDTVLSRAQVSDTATTAGSRALVEGALSTYRDSLEFYGELADAAGDAEVRVPGDGESTALVVTDRHDNVSMDPVARVIADRAQARLLIDLGDDTSTGSSWEAFSINSLAREFSGFDTVAVAGNHDTGGLVEEQMRDKGFTVLDGEAVTVAGIRFIGESDPRASGLTAGYSGDEGDNIGAIGEQDERLTEAACDAGDVTVAAVHSSASAKQLAASGCVDLVLSGHLHRQVGPTTVDGENGRTTTTLATGSTGGAVYAFALGSKLRRQAQVTVVTFSDGRPVGVQPVSFQPGGLVEVEDYTELDLSDR